VCRICSVQSTNSLVRFALQLRTHASSHRRRLVTLKARWVADVFVIASRAIMLMINDDNDDAGFRR
jgi:hypothetical protein